ncbi:MAG: nucleoside triphosphate pyrophosphohydrolase [Rhodospirillaceae bacterium]|nr:nucleoside triphosphate pyrophosphohydrolase [Rhodospirillaceae bacterium]|tara:strand:- start:2539 stop:3348 length:810 start_codon:yes stop_codon:yes gene_type:complete
MKNKTINQDICRLLGLVESLRDPDGGCPWDLEQTLQTISSYTLEEAYEVVDAISRENYDDLTEELGDLLFQIVLQAQIASECGAFTFKDIVEGITCKMLRRHPHVFSEENVNNSDAQSIQWETIKIEEKGGDQFSPLNDIALALPALVRSQKLGERASNVGFDWDNHIDARAKVNEELAELDAAIEENDLNAIKTEMGDVIFSLVNLCRHLHIEPESSLSDANTKFLKRFSIVANEIQKSGKNWDDCDSADLDELWEYAKQTLDSTNIY